VRVVLESPRVLRLDEAGTPPVKADEALVKLRLAGICGSDLAAYRGHSPMVRYPRVLGHELLVDVRECVAMPDLEGRRAVVDPMFPCGRCKACRRGRSNCCVDLQVMGVHVDGGLQEIRALNAGHLIPVPDGMPDDVAVLAEPLTIAYHAVQRGQVDAGQTAVVLGAGTIGLLIARLLSRSRGCRVLVVDVDAARLRLAEALGAVALQGDEESLVGQVARVTGGEMADAVFEASGNPHATVMTTALVGHTGRIVLVGWNHGPVEIDTVALMRKEADLVGSRNSFNAFPSVLQLLADGVVDPAVLITHRFTLQATSDALAVLDEGREPAVKVLITST
jgi:L-gulonate 5-dehydrogenase